MSASNSVQNYRRALSEVAQSTGLQESNWASDAWKTLWAKIDSSVLEDAYRQHDLLARILSPLGEQLQGPCVEQPSKPF